MLQCNMTVTQEEKTGMAETWLRQKVTLP